jgi:hypothetical protein
MPLYQGTRENGVAVVRRDGQPIALELAFERGFGQRLIVDWGNMNAGAWKLAFGLLCEVCPPDEAEARASTLLVQVVSRWPDQGWSCTREGLVEWLHEQRDIWPQFMDVVRECRLTLRSNGTNETRAFTVDKRPHADEAGR